MQHFAVWRTISRLASQAHSLTTLSIHVAKRIGRDATSKRRDICEALMPKAPVQGGPVVGTAHGKTGKFSRFTQFGQVAHIEHGQAQRAKVRASIISYTRLRTRMASIAVAIEVVYHLNKEIGHQEPIGISFQASTTAIFLLLPRFSALDLPWPIKSNHCSFAIRDCRHQCLARIHHPTYRSTRLCKGRGVYPECRLAPAYAANQSLTLSRT